MMTNWILFLYHRFSRKKPTDDEYWLARMQKELAELKKANATKVPTKPRVKIFMVNAKEEKACIIEPKGITTINELSQRRKEKEAWQPHYQNV